MRPTPDYSPIYFGPMPTGSDRYAIAPRGWARSFVYLLMGECDRIIYVGMSRNPGSRFATHASREWWQDVTHLLLLQVDEADRFRASRAAKSVETRMIHDFMPEANISEVTARG